MKNSIPFNIWDDFYDDGYIPKGKDQRTHGYIENDMSDEEKSPIIKLIYDYILNELDMTGVTVLPRDTEIGFIHLTHARLGYMMERLENCGLKYNGIPIDFYSES